MEGDTKCEARSIVSINHDGDGTEREEKLVRGIAGQNISNNKLLDNGGSHRRWIIHYSFIFLASRLCASRKII